MEILGEDLEATTTTTTSLAATSTKKKFIPLKLKSSSIVKSQNVENNENMETVKHGLNLNTVFSQKIENVPMDFCTLCCLPILIYGRLLPCKHVMCIQCANSISLQNCIKETCQERIERIETVRRGGLFVCRYSEAHSEGGESIEEDFALNPEMSQRNQCGRSYMSQRDLTAHVKHRHEDDAVAELEKKINIYVQ